MIGPVPVLPAVFWFLLACPFDAPRVCHDLPGRYASRVLCERAHVRVSIEEAVNCKPRVNGGARR